MYFVNVISKWYLEERNEVEGLREGRVAKLKG